MRYLREALIATRQYNDDAVPMQTHRAYGWVLQRASSGSNGIIYRATRPAKPQQAPLALKISQRDDRHRTEREFAAMRTLWGLSAIQNISAYPLQIWQDIPELSGDVVVMSWVEGLPLEVAPALDKTLIWQQLLQTLARIHNETCCQKDFALRPAVMAVKQPADLITIVQQRRRRYEQGEWGAIHTNEIDALMMKAQKHWGQSAIDAPLSLILCDSNPANFIYDASHQQMRIVDWANSGLADGAFDIGDLLAQPSYVDLPEDHKAWVRHTYANYRTPDETEQNALIRRIEAYEHLMWVFWLVSMTGNLAVGVTARLSGTKQYSSDHFVRYQERYASLLRSALWNISS